MPTVSIRKAMAHRVAIIDGDGIGPEVVAQGLKVVAAAGVVLETTAYDLGGRRYLSTGEVLPDEVLEELRGYDAIYLGAIGTPEVPPGVLERGLLLKARFGLDLYINLRPFKGRAGGLSSASGAGGLSSASGAGGLSSASGAGGLSSASGAGGLDAVVIRENTEGSYAGEGGTLRKGTPFEVATQGSVNTRMGVERCVRFAFDLAEVRDRRHVTLVHKTNVLTFAGDLWQRTFDEVAAEFPGVTTGYDHIDAACIHMVERPERYDVIVTDNLFGDILTDLAGALAGGIGLAASANLNPARTGPSLFEPVHGSAPDIVGTGKANPLAAISSAALLLDWIGESEAAARIAAAVAAVVASGVTGSTEELAEDVISRL